MNMASTFWLIAAFLGLVSAGLVEYQSSDNRYEKTVNGWTPDLTDINEAISEMNPSNNNGVAMFGAANNSFSVHIRRSDQFEADKFEANYVTPQLLQEVFELESLPRFLKTESDSRIVPIIPSALSKNDFYIIKGPGEEVKGDMKILQSRATGDDDTSAAKNTRRYNIPVLSGSAWVGQLYDGTNDQILADKFLWSEMDLIEADITSVETETYIEESVTDRVSHLSVSASLSISLYAGLIQISGSANYLNDEIETDEYVRMTFKFSKKGRQVSVRSDSSKTTKISKICTDAHSKKLPATHVITEVKYGFNAFLLFQTKKSNKQTKQEIGGSLSIVIKKIPAFSIEGSGELKLTDSEKEITSNLEFKFHGDTVIDPPPQTYLEAIDVYKALPESSKDNERVVSFSIAPLSEYCDETDNIVNVIADENIRSVSEMMEDFEKVRKYLRQLKNSNLALDFQRYRAVLLDAEQRFEEKRSYFTSELQALLPQVRADATKATELATLLTEYKTSRYERETFTGFLDTRQKEIETAEFIIYNEGLPNSTYIDLGNTGDMAECIIGHEYALVYKLQILPDDATKLGDSFANGPVGYNENDKWFMKEEEVGQNRPLMDVFKKLAVKNQEIKASICFLVKLDSLPSDSDGSDKSEVDSEESKRFQLTLLKSGETIMYDFVAPHKIQTQLENVVKITSRKLKEVELSVGYKLKALTLETSSYKLRATYNEIDESGKILNGPFETQQELDKTNQDRTNPAGIPIKGLTPGSSYKIEFSIGLYEGTTLITEGETSDPFYFATLPTSPPSKDDCVSAWDSITFKWNNPTTGMVNGTVYRYAYSLSQGSSGMATGISYEFDMDEDVYTDQKLYLATAPIIGHEQKFTKNDNIQPATSYEFDLRLIAPEKEITMKSGLKTIQNMESEKVKMHCNTKPPTPTGLNHEHQPGDDSHIVRLSWDDQTALLAEGQFLRYNVWLAKSPHNDETPELKTATTNSLDLTDLDPAQGYKVTVSLVTHDFGESAESVTPKSFTTKANTDSQQSEIDNLRQSVDKQFTIYDDKFSDIEAKQIPELNTGIDAAVKRIDGIDVQIPNEVSEIGKKIDALDTICVKTDDDNYGKIATLDTDYVKTTDSDFIKIGTLTTQVTTLDSSCVKSDAPNYQNIFNRLTKVEDNVWFDAWRTSDFTKTGSSTFSIITYTHVHGYNGYNGQNGLDRSSGRFTAPRGGDYQFIIQVFKQNGKDCQIKIKKEDSVISTLYGEASTGADGDSLTGTVIARLDKGQRVWVDTRWNLGSNSDRMIHFTGILINPY